jgi:hypothetical protein
MATRFRFLFFFVFAAWLFVTGGARADEPTAADKETARGLMDRGDELTAEGDKSGALKAYEGAYSFVRVPSTGAALARTLAALGRFAEAKRIADEVIAMPTRPNEPDVFVSSRAEAKQISADAAPKIAKLTVTIEGASGQSTTVTLDGKELSADELAKGIEVDPGEHIVNATAADRKGETKATLAAGEARSVTLKLVAKKQAKAVAKPATTTSSKRTLGFVIGGIGIVGLATAGVTGAMLLSRDQKIKDNCPNKECNREGRDLIDGNKPLFAINAVAWGVGVVGLGVGAYLVLSSKSGAETPTETAVGPTLMPGGAGLSLGRSF